ncbi:hypothetical protein PHLGIDRAFT_107115 [Phlebiopsis gigantea 11061_1 CR5-6]|uniref:Xylanolytic transcriptional activator regulatory domain-containing protein n=1 Tax=Phlebiopsis gigantea (strain 11061_1 CR5-6) TaxID=745531 RepID=A0A0C3RX17_PHLG1|nr:hypothetical protein PHLGIDRAFT_107115 [Phlebiopsis gigantea 11061_1 CR5-6]
MSVDGWGVSSVDPTQPQHSPLEFALTTTQTYTTVTQDFQVMPSSWPPNLPNPEVTRHLVHAFFAFFVHAGRLFHGPTFLALLDLSPTDPRFPSAATLHTICAVGSMFTADIAPTPVHTGQGFPYEIFTGRWRRRAVRPDSFAEQQIAFAKVEIESNIELGERLFEGVQAQVLVTWFFLHQGRWAECFISAGLALRYASACGLSKEEPFKPKPPRKALLLKAGKHGDLLPEPQTHTEEEVRRNVFWLAYAMERAASSGSSYAMELDDNDICQLLPLRGDYFDLGKHVPLEERQFSHARNVLLQNPPGQTDSFILYIKSLMLMSRIKSFNLRYRGRHYAGETEFYPAVSSPDGESGTYDVRQSPRFRELEQLVCQFRESWPPHLKDPIQDGVVDPHLYAACVISHLAPILLHDSHMSLDSPMDVSVVVSYKATREILDLIYAISSTSYDVSLLDQAALLGWDKACRNLIEFLRVAINTNNFEQVFSLHSEICFIHAMMAKAGERMPVAYRYKKVIYDTLAQHCGEQFVEPLPETSYHRPGYVAPGESAYADPAPSMASLVNNLLTYDGFSAPKEAIGPMTASTSCVF